MIQTRRVGGPVRTTETDRTVENPVNQVQDIGRRHVLDIDDFSREEIEAVLQNTDAMKEVLQRDIKKVPTLRGKSVITLFYEASTRTRVSFEFFDEWRTSSLRRLCTPQSPLPGQSPR